MKSSKRPLTLRDVSEASGVSEMTVSRVLRNRGDVSAATRERVLRAARELGYVPNRIAGALASNRVNLVGVVIPSMSNMVFPDVLMGISDRLEGTGLQPVVGVTHYRDEKEDEVVYQMLSWRPSGLIVAGIEHSDATRKMLAGAGIPIVEIMDVDGDGIDHVVGISQHRAGYQTAHAILAEGYRRIAFLGTKMPLDHRANKRLEGFKAGLAEQGVEIVEQEFYSGGSALAKGREMTETVLTRTPDLDFIYYSNDMIGAGGLLYCLDKGIDVPGRLGLAAFNGVDLLEGLPRKLATMDACRFETGDHAAAIIAGIAEGKMDDTPQRIELTPKLEFGETLKRA